ncbi:type III secretion system outer membrane ring subunit SctC [Pseudomonas sp. NPDC090202]|uniref:type III secretion system outer membrane ring subunit SctC n=1 Tax=unclassified Pseudomonas TaxID=196821 RepID=UPI003810E15E
MMTVRPSFSALVFFFICSLVPLSVAASPSTESRGYVARQESLRGFFDGLSGALGKPVVVSKSAGQKKITGDFSLTNPERTLAKITRQLGLIWYDDGQAIYVYDAAESKSAVGSLNTITVDSLQAFMRRSGLADDRYPLRNDGRRTFYVSGPPIYVDLIMQAAQLMDNQGAELDLGQQRIGVIRLHNTFVGDRTYQMRDESIVIPGMATVIEQLLRGEKRGVDEAIRTARSGSAPGSALEDSGVTGNHDIRVGPKAMARDMAAGNIRVIAYPDTNSLLVKGLPDQVRFIENLVAALDEAKRHVELSLWIIDLQKDDLNQLGVNWQGGVKVGSQFAASLNGGLESTLDGASFMMQIQALERENRANVVSRPMILTQENVPAIFDNNRTFYTRLVGERAVELQHVTYGTMVNVLPRFGVSEEIEMSLTIEDGDEVSDGKADKNAEGALPTVGRTRISTVARVPQGKSLLIGGFTRDERGEQIGRIPVLGSIPVVGRLFSYRQSRNANTVRVFLIQPREIRTPLPEQASDLAAKASDFGMGLEAQRAIWKAIER